MFFVQFPQIRLIRADLYEFTMPMGGLYRLPACQLAGKWYDKDGDGDWNAHPNQFQCHYVVPRYGHAAPPLHCFTPWGRFPINR